MTRTDAIPHTIDKDRTCEAKTCTNSACSCHHPGDEAAGFQVNENFRRFDPTNDMFNRAVWDETVQTERVRQFFESYHTDRATFRKVEGFTHRDYALRNASWYMADFTADLLEESHDRKEGFLDSFTLFREQARVKYTDGTPESNSRDVKRAGRYLGADLVGICRYDKRWVYTHIYSRRDLRTKPAELLDDLPYVVVVGNEMDIGTMDTVPSALSGAATGQGYSREIISVLSLTQYIRNLGYRAVASLNDTALSVPLAVQAGLGEYGRLGLLITKAYGPRVRLAKIFTDFPLQPDQPIHFGVPEFCAVCQRCARACPSKAIPMGAPSAAVYNISNIMGVHKWTIDAEKCFAMWTSQGTDCSICIRICPYNKDYKKWHHRVARWLAGTRLRRVIHWLDVWLGYGKRKSPAAWWNHAGKTH